MCLNEKYCMSFEIMCFNELEVYTLARKFGDKCELVSESFLYAFIKVFLNFNISIQHVFESE